MLLSLVRVSKDSGSHEKAKGSEFYTNYYKKAKKMS